MKLLIAGDLALQGRLKNIEWSTSALEYAFSEVKKISAQCDHSIVNLESPVTDSNRKILKDGPTLKNPLSVFDIICYCGFDIITLANNHLNDYGDKGVMDTIHRCKEHNLISIGAGSIVDEARKPLVISEKGDMVIGVINACEHESSIATTTQAGSNPLDFVNLYYDITELKKKVDRVVVILHGGREHYQLPTPRMKREYRLLIEYGADVIVNHHQHCYSGYEIYKSGFIFYGLGNFFFDSPNRRNSKWNQGLLLELDLNKDKIDFRLYPYEQCNEEAIIRVKDFDVVKESIEGLNSIINDDTALKKEFDKLVSSVKPLWPFLPLGNRFFRTLYFRGWTKSFISKKSQTLMENAISCETHREVLLRYFEQNKHHE